MPLLIDVGLTLLGGPSLSPAKFMGDLLSLPAEAGPPLSDLVFCREHRDQEHLASDLAAAFSIKISDRQRRAISDYWDNQLEACRPLPGAESFCRHIIERGYDYYIVSNLWKPFHLALTRYLPQMEAEAEKCFLSYKMGSRKPGSAFYDQVYSGLQSAPEKAVMIGDSLSNDIMPCLARGSRAIMLPHARRPFSEEARLKIKALGFEQKFQVAASHEQCLEMIDKLRSSEA